MTVLVRHAESEWNRAFGTYRIDAGITDPGLTPTGVGQARELADRLLGSGIGRIVASPYRRTLQTAAIVAEALEVPVEVEPLVRERCAFSCDQGSAPQELARDWPDLDLGGLGPCWWGGAIESVEILGSALRPVPGAAAPPTRPRHPARRQPLGLHPGPDRPRGQERGPGPP